MAKKTSLKDAATAGGKEHPTLKSLMEEVGGKSEEKQVSIHIYVPKSKRNELKIQCAKRDISMSKLLSGLIDHFIEETPELVDFVDKYVER